MRAVRKEPGIGARGVRLFDLVGAARSAAEPILKESFTGYYRWHAKRTLHQIETARGLELGGTLAGASMLEELVPGVGYVYYIFVGKEHRRQGVGAALLDDALSRFRRRKVEVVFGVAESGNRASVGLFRSRGFRIVPREEVGWREGGLGAWGLRTRMRIIQGEVLLGLRLNPPRKVPRAVETRPKPLAPRARAPRR